MDKSIEVAYQKLYRLTGGVQPRYIHISPNDEDYINEQSISLEVVIDPSLRPGQFYLTTKPGAEGLVVDGSFRFNV